MRKTLCLLSIITLTLSCSSAFAVDFDQISPVNPIEIRTIPQSNVVTRPRRATLSHNDVHNQYAIAYDRFVQSNVKSAYVDFRILVESMIPNDYAYMQMAEKFADIGLFNISDIAISKISDKELSGIMVDDIKRYYFPSKKMKRDDEIYLGEVYSNIVYNDQSLEATGELVKNIELLSESDYANYVSALGYLKSGNIPQAEFFINKAIVMNAQNLNYKKLKAEILAQGKKPQDSIKIVEYMKQQRLYSSDFSRKVDSLEQYILYKTKKNELQKMYHLGYYYYYENELNKSIRTLQGAVSSKKPMNADVYSLMARVYFDMNEFEKAQDTAMKAYKLDKTDPMTLLVLGDIKYRAKDYKMALDYYKDAQTNEKISSLPSIKVAQTYQMLDKEKKALEIYDKILKTYSDSYLAYYHVALKDKSKEIAYLKKAVAINMAFKDGWIDLARVELERQNPEQAKKYLSIANYIDENDFRYYYYLGLIYKNQGLTQDAVYNFRKSLILNPGYELAEKELSI